MANRTRSDDTADGGTGSSSGNEAGNESINSTDCGRLSPDKVDELRNLADRIDGVAETLPLGAARHHARKAAEAARTTADNDARLIARRAAVGKLVTELRTAADEADSTRDQYRLLELLYERALPATRGASTAIYA